MCDMIKMDQIQHLSKRVDTGEPGKQAFSYSLNNIKYLFQCVSRYRRLQSSDRTFSGPRSSPQPWNRFG